jgi:Predicted nucleic-acid-binding protein implicated in transcription termination
MKPKKELVRVVKSPEQEISLDLTGRKPGRGAYVCRSIDCLKAARKARRFEKAFSCKIPDEVFDRMEEEISRNE